MAAGCLIPHAPCLLRPTPGWRRSARSCVKTAYSKSSKKIDRPSRERFGGPPGGSVRSPILRDRLGVITLSRAGIPLLRVKTADTRCLIESLEQRDALGSHDEHSDAVWFQTPL